MPAFSRSRRPVALLLASSLAAGCAPAVFPPPTVPERELPALVPPAPPPVPGTGQVTFATDEPSIVERITGHTEGMTSDGYYVNGTTYEQVCDKTPCVANLRLGDDDLRFTSLADPDHNGTATITVGARPTAYNYALGHNHPNSQTGGIVALTLGGAGLVLGGIVSVIASTPDSEASSSDATVAYAATAAAAALTVYGIYLLARGGTVQNGSGVQWTPGQQ